ncbi:ester cyclase [Paracoccus sp. 11-3]|uniref:Ester cyclase n=1 Tax=Paracoccus amoyensis TaxID=2760093 RepID=A0A926G6W2_9RHOB|nr:ester cyclase [Paracoccus amoyensis]MBC9245613.1 ester cyclase [Paracoccus amoyensis]
MINGFGSTYAARAVLGALIAALPIVAHAQEWPGSKAGEPPPQVEGMPELLARNLANFDDLDFNVYTKQDWENLHKSHAEDILVHYPDGHTTTGNPDHIKELAFMWTFAPDNRITEHPVRFGTADGGWTAVMGYLDGTFTEPMVLPDGTTIEPTGKAYHLPMATLGRWNADGTMAEEYLFWDNATLMQQIGVGQ